MPKKDKNPDEDEKNQTDLNREWGFSVGAFGKVPGLKKKPRGTKQLRGVILKDLSDQIFNCQVCFKNGFDDRKDIKILGSTNPDAQIIFILPHPPKLKSKGIHQRRFWVSSKFSNKAFEEFYKLLLTYSIPNFGFIPLAKCSKESTKFLDTSMATNCNKYFETEIASHPVRLMVAVGKGVRSYIETYHKEFGIIAPVIRIWHFEYARKKMKTSPTAKKEFIDQIEGVKRAYKSIRTYQSRLG